METTTHIADIVHVIQLSVAPVFLLTAVSTLIGALNVRLGRVVDRRRALVSLLSKSESNTNEITAAREELAKLVRRGRLIYFAIFAAVVAALLVCLVVASAFLGALVAADLTRFVASFFILAMLSLIVCLMLFLREIYLAVQDPAVWRVQRGRPRPL
jgi:hypothetical protein